MEPNIIALEFPFLIPRICPNDKGKLGEIKYHQQ